ncbi:unnamed protein product, partial [Nesidiocoris tenuis]
MLKNCHFLISSTRSQYLSEDGRKRLPLVTTKCRRTRHCEDGRYPGSWHCLLPKNPDPQHL